MSFFFFFKGIDWLILERKGEGVVGRKVRGRWTEMGFEMLSIVFSSAQKTGIGIYVEHMDKNR